MRIRPVRDTDVGCDALLTLMVCEVTAQVCGVYLCRQMQRWWLELNMMPDGTPNTHASLQNVFNEVEVL